MPEIVLATKNKGKLAEFRSLLESTSWRVLSLWDLPDIPDIAETGITFEENAKIKARTVADLVKIVTVADDSGLEVDYLNGRPGVFSARFSGPEATDQANNIRLLELLAGVPSEKRTARFKCVIAISIPEGEDHFCEGVCEGIIGEEPVGEGGFGYDPLFWLPQYGRTMAQLSMEEKNQISHRGQAFRNALPVLARLIDRLK